MPGLALWVQVVAGLTGNIYSPSRGMITFARSGTINSRISQDPCWARACSWLSETGDLLPEGAQWGGSR